MESEFLPTFLSDIHEVSFLPSLQTIYVTPVSVHIISHKLKKPTGTDNILMTQKNQKKPELPHLLLIKVFPPHINYMKLYQTF